MPAINIGVEVKTLLSNKRINKPDNDVVAPLRHPTPMQYRLGVPEAEKLVAAMKRKYSAENQRLVLEEIHRRIPRRGGPRFGVQFHRVVLTTRPAADVMNGYARELGLDIRFTYGQRKPASIPRG